MALKILHVIERLGLGGASRALIASAGFSFRNERTQHRVLSISPADPAAIDIASKAGITMASADCLLEEADHADILHIHFWNNPDLYTAFTAELPPTRICLTCHVAGTSSPQILTSEIIDFADLILVTTPLTLETANEVLHGKTLLAPSPADFDRLKGFTPSPHTTFNIGYIGTIDFVKMHPAYVALHAGLDIAEARVIVCGEGAATPVLARQIADLGADERFQLRGYVQDIAPVLSELDVFGYPLCEDNYSTSELVLQEAMFAGIPSVVFSYGGAALLVTDGVTGFVVGSEAQYVERIIRLHRQPDERARIGRAAAEYARSRLGVENLGPLIDAAYERLLCSPKHKRAAIPQLSGAESFIRSLGSGGNLFRQSQFPEHIGEDEAADAKIASASPALASASAGGILHYRRAYPNDPMLRLWAGLIFLSHSRPALAAAEFKASIKLGISDKRAAPYLSKAILACGKS